MKTETAFVLFKCDKNIVFLLLSLFRRKHWSGTTEELNHNQHCL